MVQVQRRKGREDCTASTRQRQLDHTDQEFSGPGVGNGYVSKVCIFSLFSAKIIVSRPSVKVMADKQARTTVNLAGIVKSIVVLYVMPYMFYKYTPVRK